MSSINPISSHWNISLDDISPQNMIISNIYPNGDNDNYIPIIYQVSGTPRTGSTVLYNILRILVHDKIDPNVYYGYRIIEGNIKMHLWTENYAIIDKRHDICDTEFKLIGDSKPIKLFLSHRNVSDQICSALRMGFDYNKGPSSICNNYWNQYKSCLQRTELVYDMNYHILVQNRTKIIEDLVKILDISHVMNKYDYMRIENELNNLRPPNDEPHLLTQLHSSHIANDSYSCDMKSIMDTIQNNPKCLEFYQYVNDLLDKDL